MVLLAVALTADAAQYYVRTGGNNSNSGLVNNDGGAWLTVQKAANTMVAGDSVLINTGTYAETVTTAAHGSAGSYITFAGTGFPKVKAFDIQHRFVELNGIESDGTGTAGAAFRVNSGAHSVRLVGTRFLSTPTNIYGMFINYQAPVATNGWFEGNVWKNSGFHLVNIPGAGHTFTNNLFENPKGWDCMRLIANNVTVVANTFTNISGPPGNTWEHPDIVQAFTASGGQSTNVVFERNLVINCATTQIGFFEDQALLGQLSHWTFRNNLYVNVEGAVQMFTHHFAWYNNTFYRCAQNTGSPLIFQFSTDRGVADNCTVLNNIFVECGASPSNPQQGWYGVVSGVTGFVGNYNLVIGTGAGTTKTGFNTAGREANGINGQNPMLNSAYALSTGSPAINRGVTIAGFSVDRILTVRPQGPAWDIGQNEWISAASQLGFSGQPTPTVAGATITPAVRVTAYDSSGVPLSGYTGTITVAIGSNPGGGTLSGTLAVAAFGGIATFSNLSINNAGNGYTLTATAAGLTSATSASFNVTPAAPPTPGVPGLVSPSNGASGQSTTPTLTWNASANSTSYDIQVATDSGFGTIVATQTALTATSYVPSPVLSAATTYFWRVRGRNSGGTSAYSAAFSFSTALPAPAVPVLSSPADGATGVALNPTLSWGAVSFAANYRIQVATDIGFSSLVFDQTQTATSAAPSLSAATTYYWHVRAQNATGNSAYSTTRSFTTSPPPAPAAPSLSSPANGATGVSITPTMSWAASATAASYRIQIATDAGFSAVIYDISNLTGLSTVPTLLNSTLYYWHVSASNAGGTSAYSGTRTFTTIAAVPAAPAAPTLSSPADTATDVSLNPTLAWNASSGADNYRIQVATDVGFTAIVSDVIGLTSTSYAPSLVAATQYFWRVNAANTGGTSAFSAIRSFTTLTPVEPPPTPVQPVLSSPANGATGQSTSPTLVWFNAFPATSYHLQVSTVSNFASTVIDLTGIAGTNYVAALSTGTTYYWRVLGSNTSGDSAYSTAFSFTTVPAIPAAPALSSPANGATGQATSPVLTWVASPGASSYGLQVATDAGFGALVVNITGISSTTYTPALSAGTTYFWRANANNTGGTSGFSSSRTFTTVPTVPAVPALGSPANGATGVSANPTLTWIASPGATSYHVQVATDAGFGALVADVAGIAGVSYVPSLSSATVYFWRVLATNSGGSSAYTAARTFTTVPVVPVAPSQATPPNGALGVPSTLTLTWNPAPGATSYRVQVSTVANFASTVVDAIGVSTASYYVTLAGATQYFWRLSASNAGGTSAFSGGTTFTTQTTPTSQPIVNSKARLLMLIDRQGHTFRTATSVTNNADKLLVNYSFFVPGDYLINNPGLLRRVLGDLDELGDRDR